MGPMATPIRIAHQTATIRIAGDERPRTILRSCCILTFGIAFRNSLAINHFNIATRFVRNVCLHLVALQLLQEIKGKASLPPFRHHQSASATRQ